MSGVLNTVTKEVTENLEKYELGIAVQKLYDFILRTNSATGTLNWPKTRLMAKDETCLWAARCWYGPLPAF